MRIIAGTLGSRSIKSIKGSETRPTSDKVKEAIFSTLGNAFNGGRFLDCYSGTGSMALEALSRGMDEAVCIEISKAAVSVLRENIDHLGVKKKCKVYMKDVFTVLPTLTEPFDVVYIDPPYAKQKNIKLLKQLEIHQLVKDQGIVVIESLSEEAWPNVLGAFYKMKEKEYRNTKITYYRKENVK